MKLSHACNGHALDRVKKAGPQKAGPGPKSYPKFCETLGFCRKVLQNVSHSKKLVEERFCRTPKKGSAELWEPNPAFQALQILLPQIEALTEYAKIAHKMSKICARGGFGQFSNIFGLFSDISRHIVMILSFWVGQ